MFRDAVFSLCLVGSCFMFNGCASVFYGPRQDVMFYSSPSGAQVEVRSRKGNQRYEAVTPASLNLESKYVYDVTFSKVGYQDVRRDISNRINVFYVLDYLFYIVPGLIDTMSGSGWILEPSRLDVIIPPASVAQAISPHAFQPGIRRQSTAESPIDLTGFPYRDATAAILTFDARAGVSIEEVAMLADRFAVELGRVDAYKLVSRSKMKEVLELQQYSASCNSTECAVEVGKLLGVEYMIYGSIGRIGTMYTMNVGIASVELGSVIAAASVDYDGRIEGLLTDGMTEGVDNLLRAVAVKDGGTSK